MPLKKNKTKKKKIIFNKDKLDIIVSDYATKKIMVPKIEELE